MCVYIYIYIYKRLGDSFSSAGQEAADSERASTLGFFLRGKKERASTLSPFFVECLDTFLYLVGLFLSVGLILLVVGPFYCVLRLLYFFVWSL